MDEVTVVDLAFHADARGWLMAGPEGLKIAYTYVTCCWPGAVKAWHRHAKHTDRLMCVYGLARVVVAASWLTLEAAEWGAIGRMGLEGIERSVEQFVIGPLAPKMVVIPPGLWHGFEAVGGELCVVVNTPDQLYDPGDEERADPDAIQFEWGKAKG